MALPMTKNREVWPNFLGPGVKCKVVEIAPRFPIRASMGGDLRGHTSLFRVKAERASSFHCHACNQQSALNRISQILKFPIIFFDFIKFFEGIFADSSIFFSLHTFSDELKDTSLFTRCAGQPVTAGSTDSHT